MGDAAPPIGSEIDGAERAAVLLMSLGESEAAEILKLLGAKDVQKVGQAMAVLKNVSRARAISVMDNFVQTLESHTSLGVDSDEYVRRVMVGALGEDKAAGLIDRVLLGRNSKGLEALKWMETRSVADLIRNEHPQIIAIVIASLDADQGAEVISLLPQRMRHDVLMRIAWLDGIQPAALRELDEIMEKQFSVGNNLQASSVGGVKKVANIMNMMDSSEEQDISRQMEEVDAELAGRIHDLMFVFDDLAGVDDRGIQTLLREVSNDILGLALKGADVRVKDKITKNMSQRAAEMLIDDMESRGPAKVTDVEAAQKEILVSARRLAEAGTIELGASSEATI